MTDSFGNQYREYVWNIEEGYTGTKTIRVTTNFDVTGTGNPAPETFSDPFPVSSSGMYQYLNPSAMVQSTNGELVSKANEITTGATTEAEAVDRIMNFVRTSIPNQATGVPKDAVSSLHSSSGTCVNRANLALGLLRASGIPSRFVNGIVSDSPSIKAPFSYSGSSGYVMFQWGKELHAWVEVYYPQKGWVAYDPWMNKGFIDQRHVKTGIALDSNAADPSTGSFIETFKTDNVNQGSTGSVSTAITFSNVQDSGEYTARSLSASPSGALMMGRDMVNAPTPTPTATPILTPTPVVNVTVTPTPSATVTITPTPEATATATPVPEVDPSPSATTAPVLIINGTVIGTGDAGNVTTYYITGTLTDEKTGMPISDAVVTIDGVPVIIDSEGAFTAGVSVGGHKVNVSAPGYGNGSIDVTITDKDIPVVVKMQKAGTASATDLFAGKLPLPGFGLILALAGILIAGLWRYGRT
jgi:transglutaminase-like putative cysteine protease